MDEYIEKHLYDVLLSIYLWGLIIKHIPALKKDVLDVLNYKK